MSLLTEKQIVEIIGMATQQDEFAKILKLKFDHWNKNQHPFNVNWDDAPDHAKIASIRIHWLTEINAGWSTTTEIISFDRPIVAHPHAEMIMKFAEVAQRRADPWVEFEITFDEDADYWSSCDVELRFLVDGRRYRHIGDKK
jgi:hypothetical protein